MEDTPAEQSRELVGKGRVEALSDGVFAIVVTLPVLEIRALPPGSTRHSMRHALQPPRVPDGHRRRHLPARSQANAQHRLRVRR